MLMICKACTHYNAEGGECRRNAPIPVGHRQFAQWPKVREEDWCGQHEAVEALGALETPASAIAAE